MSLLAKQLLFNVVMMTKREAFDMMKSIESSFEVDLVCKCKGLEAQLRPLSPKRCLRTAIVQSSSHLWVSFKAFKAFNSFVCNSPFG